MNSSNSSPSPELLRLISGLVDGELSASDHQRLCELLRDNAEAQAEYRRLMSVHTLLKFDLGQSLPISSPMLAVDDANLAGDGRPRPSRFAWRRVEKRWRTALIAGAGLAACIALLFVQSRLGKQQFGLLAAAGGDPSSASSGTPPFCLVVLRRDADSSPSLDEPRALEEVQSGLSANQMADIVTYMKERSARAKSFEGNHPKHVLQNTDGSVTLDAKSAQIYGTTLVFEEQFGNLGFWGSSDDWVVWKFSTKVPVTFDVVLDYACHHFTENNRFVLAVDEQEIDGKIAGTGTWNDYRQMVVGQLRLEPGDHRLVFRSTDELQGFLVDLRSVVLRPAADGSHD